MAEEAPQGDPDLVQAAHAVQILQWALSTDGKNAMFVFEIAEEPGKKFAVTMPTALLGPTQSAVNQARTAAVKRDLPSGHTVFMYPKTYQVGSSPDIRGHIALSLDDGMPTEAIYMIPDVNAYEIAKAMQADILGRASPADALKLQHGPARLILPAGVQRP